MVEGRVKWNTTYLYFFAQFKRKSNIFRKIFWNFKNTRAVWWRRGDDFKCYRFFWYSILQQNRLLIEVFIYILLYKMLPRGGRVKKFLVIIHVINERPLISVTGFGFVTTRFQVRLPSWTNQEKLIPLFTWKHGPIYVFTRK